MPTRIEAENGRSAGICSKACHRKDGATKGGSSRIAISGRLHLDVSRSNQWSIYRYLFRGKRQESLRIGSNYRFRDRNSDYQLHFCFSKKMDFFFHNRSDVYKLQRIRFGSMGGNDRSVSRTALESKQCAHRQNDNAYERWAAFVSFFACDVDRDSLVEVNKSPKNIRVFN